jgi:hypothetical protein
MKRKAMFFAFAAAIAGIGCSLIVSYDGYGDGAPGDDGGGSDGTTTGDGDVTGEDGGRDSSTGDASPDALDGGPDGATNKRYAIVLLGGEAYNDAGVSLSVADVEYAMINPDGTLGPWSATTSMPDDEDAVGATAWGSSVFIMDDFGAAAAVMQPDGGLSTWATLADVNRNSPQLAAVDGRIYVAGGTVPSGPVAPEVYYATITGPQTIGPWTPTTSLSVIDGGPRNDTTIAANGKMLYLVGGDHANVDITSIISAPIDNTGAVGQWTENTPLPTPGDHTRSAFARGYLTMFGGSLDVAADRGVYVAAVLDGGVLGAWQNGAPHPDVSEPVFASHANFAYLIGGIAPAGVDVTTVYYAPIEAAGLPGVWQTTASIKLPRHNGTAVVVEVP